MSALWTSADAAAATGGRATADRRATGVSIDTRELARGDLFVALADQRDGHDFVAAALAAGAAGALVSRIPDGVAPDAPLLIVPDVLQALENLAAAARARTAARVVGITGSAGKTSTKDMLRLVLAGQGRVHAAEKSLNNHWGVPLTLARMPADTDFALIEIGMNAPGEIAPLARIARLDVALITTVAAAHLAAFDSVSAIAREKASILDGLVAGGTAVLNGDLETTPILLEKAAACGARVILFGAGADLPYALGTATQARDATVVQARVRGAALLFKVASAGRHFALNALGALAVVEALGADVGLAACAMGRWAPPLGRGTRERRVLDLVDDHLSFDLIDDAFNANPASVAAALDVLIGAAPEDGIGSKAVGRRIAILGDMLELGDTEAALHRAIADHPGLAAVHVIHCVGPRMRHLWHALPPGQRGEWVETAEALVPRAHRLIDAGDVVLVKGSKGIRVSLVVDALRKLGQGTGSTPAGAA